MEARLARISHDVKTTHRATRSDIEEVLYYLKNQPSSLNRPEKGDCTDPPAKQPKHAEHLDVGFMWNGRVGGGGKKIFVPSYTLG